MRAVAVPALLLLAASLPFTACSDVPGIAEPVSAAVPETPGGLDSLVFANRQLLLAVLEKLEALEARYEQETRPQLTRLDTLATVTASMVSAVTPASAVPPGTPWGVPHQLADIRAQLATLEQKIDDITVGVGLPAPPGSNLTISQLFQRGSRVCLNLGTSGNMNVAGKFRTRSEGRGGAGIDFYGNKLLVEVRGDAAGHVGGQWNVVEGGVQYSFCVTPSREEAAALIAALPFDENQFESRYETLASQMGTLRASPFRLIDPNFSMFDLESYPARGPLLDRLDGFFAGLRGQLCSDLKNRFDIVDDLSLGVGQLGGIVSPAASQLQSRFNSDC